MRYATQGTREKLMKSAPKNSVTSVSSVAGSAFSLVELLIVISILGIMAAIVIPTLQDHSKKAKEAAAKDNLRILRTAIEAYAARNNGVPPGYPDNDPTQTPDYLFFYQQLIERKDYLSVLPDNPITSQEAMKVIVAPAELPAAPALTDVFGWYYDPATKTVKLNAEGTDSENTAYFDY